MHRPLHVPEHDGDVRAQPDRVRGAVRVEPLLGVDLVGADDGPHLVVEDLGRGAGERGQAGVLRRSQVVAQGHAQTARALGDLERGEAVHVDLRRDLLHRARHREVVVAVEVGVDATLQAHLGGAAVDRFQDAALDLLVVEEVGRAAEVQRERALRERAEPALERAHVRVVDVAVADERDRVTHRVAPELVGDRGDLEEVGATRAEQGDDLVDVDLLAGEDAVEHLAHRSAGPGRPARRHRRREQRGRRGPAARGPGVVARQALEVGRAAHREAHVVVQPAVAVAHVLGVHGEARRERLARGLGGARAARRAAGHGRSGFTWSGVTGETPPQSSIPAATNAARSSGSDRLGGACRWIDGSKHQPGGGDGPEELVPVARGRAPHRRTRLGQEVLDDHLLHVAVALVGGGDGEERLEPLGPGLADADQDPGGERHPGPARGLERGQPSCRGLVGRAGVRAARFTETGGEGLDHHPLRRRHRPEPHQLVLGERPGVGVGEQPGLGEHDPGRGDEVVDRRGVPAGRPARRRHRDSAPRAPRPG